MPNSSTHVQHNPPLQLTLLGHPAVRLRDGRDARIPAGKPLALLCFVALDAGPVSRDDIARLLWPHAPEYRVRHSVRQAMSTLRKQAGDEIIADVDGELHLGPGIDVDITRFHDALAADEMQRALDLWQTGPLHGLSVPGAPGFERWAEEVCSRLIRTFKLALLNRAHAEMSSHERLRWLEHASRLDPGDQNVHEDLIRHHLDIDDIAAAKRALLQAETHTDPADPARLNLLRGELQRAARQQVTEASNAQPFETLVVTRQVTTDRLLAQWRRAQTGDISRVAMLGPAGAGKSRLLERFADRVRQRGGQVARSRVTNPNLRIDYGVLAGLLRDLLALPGAAGISAGSNQVFEQLLPSRAHHPFALGAQPNAVTLADALSDLLQAVSDEAPLLLCIDNAQWIDEASLRVLIDAALRTGQNRRVMMLGCVDTEGQAFPGLASLEADGLIEVLEIEHLSARGIAAWLTPAFADQPEPALHLFGERLYYLTGGNLHQLTELLRRLVAQEQLVSLGGQWQVRRDLALAELPQGHITLARVQSTIAAMPALQRRIAEAVASLDAPVEGVGISATTGLSDEQVRASLRLLTRDQFVHWTRAGTVQITVPAARDLLISDLPKTLRALARMRIPLWRAPRLLVRQSRTLRRVVVVLACALFAVLVLAAVA